MNIEECYHNFCNHIVDFHIRTGEGIDVISKNAGVPRWDMVFISYRSSQKTITLENFIKLCNYLNVSPNEMLSPIEPTEHKTPADK